MDKTVLKQIIKEEMQKMLQEEASHSARVKAAEAFGATLGGSPDIALGIAKLLRDTGYRTDAELADAIEKGYNRGQAAVDSEYQFSPSYAEDDFDD